MRDTIVCNRLGLAMLALFVLLGCGKKSGVERLSVAGSITFKGQPVPGGFICFTPNPRKGNRGPQGVATIVNGQYNTEDLKGKGSVSGPQIVEIRGLGDGNSGTGDSLPASIGSPLFPPYFTEADISSEVTTLDFEVPDNVSSKKKK